MGGVTGWHFAIMRHARYAPKLSNYCGSPVGRTFPSSAGFITSELFFTDNDGTYFFPTRDFHPEIEIHDGKVNLVDFLSVHKKRIRKLSNKRLYIPQEEPYMEGHNTWIANHKGSTLVIPVGDMAQHVLVGICYFTQNGYSIYDDIAKKPIPEIEKFGNLVDVNKPIPLTVLEQGSLAEMAGVFYVVLCWNVDAASNRGLGGYMYEGIDRHTILGASGDPAVPGLGFRYDTDERWSLPNPMGLQGVFEGYCPPHYKNMRDATEALAKRKFGDGGVYNLNTPGAWNDSPKVRGSAAPYTEEFKECVALQA
jgi:hypothetical protein